MKSLFKTSPISYSRFLRKKRTHIYIREELEEQGEFLNHNESLEQIKSIEENDSINESDSVDVDFFRRSIFLHYQHSYARKKWQSWVYRFIFFGLSVLFIALGLIIFFKTVNFAYGFYFKNTVFVKNAINVLCLLFGGSAFLIGLKIHPEKEAINYLFGKVERELTAPAKKLQVEFNAILSSLKEESSSSHDLWIDKTLKMIKN